MLQSISIRNFAIIDALDVEFECGLNVLTGETGAGKSILIGAIDAIVGARTGADVVRAGAERATIDAVFDLSEAPELQVALVEEGYDLDEACVIISREITSTGRSLARISGRPATISQLKSLGELLIDLHGQHEHQSLLLGSRHLGILDSWGDLEHQELVAEVGELHRTVMELVSERDALSTDERERSRLLDLYAYQVEEIESAGLQPGEDLELDAEELLLANAQRLIEMSYAAADALNGDSGGALSLLSLAAQRVQEAAAIDPRLESTVQALTVAVSEATDASRDLSRYADQVESNPERLADVQARQDLISNLKRKYGDTIEEIIAYGDDAATKLDIVNNAEQRLAELQEAIDRATFARSTACARLSAARRTLGERFAEAVQGHLRELAMEKSRFAVQHEAAEPGPTGADRIEFLLSANLGEPLKLLSRVASGGEISRVMLAMKSALALRDSLPTMVFDEIDAGIGGRTGTVVAEKLAALAKHAQIVVITHLPQIAARADAHFNIEKRWEAGRTITSVRRIVGEERVVEVARMLGGAPDSAVTMQAAREMIGL